MMKSRLLSILMVAVMVCGCANTPPITAWAFVEPEGALARVGAQLNDKADAGLQLGYANVVEELLSVGAYLTCEIGEPVEVNNPLPLPYLPPTLIAQPYIGGQLIWADSLDKDSDFDRSGIFGGPVAGIKVKLSDNIDLVIEDQYRIAEADLDKVGKYEMHNVAMIGAKIRF